MQTIRVQEETSTTSKTYKSMAFYSMAFNRYLSRAYQEPGNVQGISGALCKQKKLTMWGISKAGGHQQHKVYHSRQLLQPASVCAGYGGIHQKKPFLLSLFLHLLFPLLALSLPPDPALLPSLHLPISRVGLKYRTLPTTEDFRSRASSEWRSKDLSTPQIAIQDSI